MTIFVCGLGRCGSSLMMQMLAKAGAKCAGEHPAFEDTRIEYDVSEWTREFDAVKVLDVHRRNWRIKQPSVYIWIDRDIHEQRKSFDKFAGIFLGMPPITQNKKFEAGLRKDRALGLQILRKLDAMNEGGIVIRITFDALLDGKIDDIAKLLGYDAQAMRSVIIQRAPTCYPGLLEAKLIEK